MEVYESTEGNVTVLILKKDCIHDEPLMSNILFGVVVDDPLHGKHFRTLSIIPPFISVRYVSMGYLYFDQIVNEAP
jgi:hypothetical protein